MSQQSDAAKNLEGLAFCVNALLLKPANMTMARNLVDRYLDDATQKQIDKQPMVWQVAFESCPHLDPIRPERNAKLSLADRLPVDRSNPFDWTEASLDGTNASPLAVEEIAAILAALHAVKCQGVETVQECSATLADIPEANLLRQMSWAALLNRVEGCEEYTLEWFKSQFLRFEQILSEQTAPSAGPPPEQQAASATKATEKTNDAQSGPFDDLRAVGTTLKGKQAKLVLLLCDRGGRVPLSDVALACDWSNNPTSSTTAYVGNWNSLKIDLNKKLKNHGWRLHQHDSHAVAKRLKTRAGK